MVWKEAFDLMGIHLMVIQISKDLLIMVSLVILRKDFPTNGNLEVVYDEEKEVVYQPVSISTRPGVQES